MTKGNSSSIVSVSDSVRRGSEKKKKRYRRGEARGSDPQVVLFVLRQLELRAPGEELAPFALAEAHFISLLTLTTGGLHFGGGISLAGGGAFGWKDWHLLGFLCFRREILSWMPAPAASHRAGPKDDFKSDEDMRHSHESLTSLTRCVKSQHVASMQGSAS